MVNLIILSLLFIISSCQVNDQAASSAPVADDICSGKTILGIAGTADCSGGGGGVTFLSFASRRDNGIFPYDAGTFATFFTDPDRIVASLADDLLGNDTFTDNHSVIPYPLGDSDGRYALNDYNGNPVGVTMPEKKHYLETIVAYDSPLGITTRANLNTCGSTGTITQRITECSTLNGRWAFYDGKKYGQDGEGDWKLVSVTDEDGTPGGTIYEVWRDERTKLLWSDKASTSYNWYESAGYSKDNMISVAESEFWSAPGTADPQIGVIMQPPSPVSVCPDVTAGKIAAEDTNDIYTYVNPEIKFKGYLAYPQVTWRLPSRNDWYLAEVNGIRKVLPNMDNIFWSASSYSFVRFSAWYFDGGSGDVGNDVYRYYSFSVRCVAPSRD